MKHLARRPGKMLKCGQALIPFHGADKHAQEKSSVNLPLVNHLYISAATDTGDKVRFSFEGLVLGDTGNPSVDHTHRFAKAVRS